MAIRRLAILAALIFLILATWPCSAQDTKSRPLFTRVPMMCYAGPYVAMLGFSSRTPLLVIPVGPSGIGLTQTVSLVGHSVIGIKCATWGIELLERESGSDHLSRVPFRIEGGAVLEQPREQIAVTIPSSNTAPGWRGMEQITDDYYQFGPRGVGDWTVSLPRAGNPGRSYFVHFVSTEKSLKADLLEKSNDGRVTKAVALVRSDDVQGGE